ncbi:MAG: hypothetical protein A07HN63_02154 [uncultured archaeon A07HN63]|nr:MAG: hypothetical protein A07HN63_02154 [uncultured archaeon A07HN63]
MPSQSPNEFVITSSVRTEIVRRVSEQSTPTDVLLSELTASDSAVYDALSTLSERGLLTEGDSGWELTAHGSLVQTASLRGSPRRTSSRQPRRSGRLIGSM